MTDDPRPFRPDVKGPEPQGPDPRAALRRKTIVLVGLMGVGKSSVGRRLAATLDLPFRDADNEVEAAAGRSIPEIFAEMGEPAFRDGERRVIARLLDEPPHVLATGGGAFVNPETRALIKSKAVAVWLNTSDEQHVALVRSYFDHGGFADITDADRSPRACGDPIHAVWAHAG